MTFHLAQVNIAMAKYSVDDPRFAGFIDNLDRINEIADNAPGFVWRHISDDDDAEAKRVFDDDTVIFNMSLWASVQDLRNFVYDSDHVQILRNRSDWFVPQDRPVMALWWQPIGQIPTIAESKQRLDSLAESGSTEYAFTFRNAIDMLVSAPALAQTTK